MSDSKKQAAVLELQPTEREALKPAELIQVRGHQDLSLYSRRTLTLLWHHAHKQGIEEGKDYTVQLADLQTDENRSIEKVDNAIDQIMGAYLKVPMPNGKMRRVHLIGSNDMDHPDRPAGTLTYSLDKRLVELLKDSRIWGRITIPVLMAFSSKYSVPLYEHICQWQGLKYKNYQDFSLDEFRQILGVEDGKYGAFGAFNKHVVKPVLMEINGLAPFNVTITFMKTGRAVTHVRVGWFQKDPDALKEAYAESRRHRAGRKERLEQRVQFESTVLPSQGDQLRKMDKEMRRSDSSLFKDSEDDGDIIEG